MTYGNDLDLSRTKIGKNRSYASALRMVSDFRDLKLSQSSWGSALTRAYYDHNWDTLEANLERRWLAATVVVLTIVVLGIWNRRRRGRILLKARHR